MAQVGPENYEQELEYRSKENWTELSHHVLVMIGRSKLLTSNI